MKKISVMCYLGIPLLLALSMGACTNAPGVPEDTGGADVGGDATPCGESADCDDGNPCTLDECIAGACSWAPVEAACDDGNPCTEGDQCMEGDCAGTPKTCDDSVFCNGEETCNAVTGACEDGTAPSIDDGVTCTLDECDEEGDKVIHVPNDTACDDGNPCTTNTCDETLDCQVADRDGEDCEDGSLCTEGDVCDGDTCIGQDVECEDEDFCNGVETCDPETGGCVDGTPPELDDGLDCTQDSCDEDLDEVVHTPEDAACDDGNSCTTDTCDGGEGCVYDTLDDGAACEDGNDCTEGDVCADGLCEPGTFVCVEDCNNEEDDDQDDLVDCDDEDCFLDMACQPGGDLCGEAFDLTLGVPLVAADAGGTIQFLGTTVGKTHEFTGACDPDTAQAVDTVHKIELGEPLGLSITGDFNGNAWASVYIFNAACTGNLACATSSSIEPTELTVVLPAGTYFITMDGAYPGDLGTYVLEVGVFLPDATETACADGVDNDADGLMDCDDDECDDAEECNILTGETCADALLLTPAPLTAAAAGTQVVITGTTAGNADNVEGSCNAAVATSPDLIYRLNLADPLVVAATFDFSGNKWPALALFRDGCAAEDELACDTGKADAAAVGPIALKAGTYLLVLDAAYNNDAGPFTLSVSFTAVPAAETLCSNGVDDDLDDLVDCDDPSCDADPVCAGYEGDNCAHPFLVNGGQPVTAAHYGQTLTLQGSTAGLQDFYTACSPNTAGSPEAVYALELGVPALVHATHDFGGTLWPAVYAMDASCDPGTLLGCDTATSGAAELDLALAPGTYYFVLDASYVGDKGPFTFTLTFAVPPATEAVCHDGIDNDVDGAADCQDGDCVADLYCLDLYEPNDTLPTAYGLGDLSGSAFTTGGATISPATLDADYFQFTLQSDHALDITLTPSGGLDGKITLLNAAGVALLSADAGGINVAETLATDLAGPGTYHVLVAGYGITKGSYVLGLVLTPLEEFDCDDGVNEDGDATTDCCDPDCAAAAPCLQESHCLDGFDDDCDGQADCDDQDCGGTPACGGADDCLDAFPVNGGLPLDGTLDGQILEEWGSTVGYADDFQGSCDGDSAAAPDAVWILTVAERVAVNAGMDYQGVMWPAVYLTDAPCGTGAELGCGAATGGWAWTGDVVLEPGTYYLIVDGAYAGDEEIYTLQVEVSAVYDTEVDCGDGEDEDFDGLADCCDTDCLGADACKEVCGDGLDNDCDTVADCCDDDCGGDAACAAEGDCLDGEDGDCDGLLDCGDWDCAAVAECAGEGCAAAEALNGGAAITAADDGLQLVVNGDTAPARNDHAGSCDADTGTAADLAFTFQVAAPIGVSVTHDFVSPVLWPAVYLYDGVCNAEGELACDATSGDAAFIAPILLQPGTYYVIVDSSWPTDAGEFTLTLDFSLPDATETSCTDGLDNDLNGATDCADETCALDPECLGESCLTALELNNGAGISAADDGLHLEVVGDTSGAKPDLEGSCDADSAEASDQVYTFVLDDPMGVQISHDFDGYNWPMVYLFQESCDAADEVACAFLNGEAPAVIPFTALEPGTYYLVVDSSYATDAGPYTLELDFIAISPTETDCADGVDNDLDGHTDCCDTDCAPKPACAAETLCADGLDNDCDGNADCDDGDCEGKTECLGETCADAIPLDGGLGFDAGDDGLQLVVAGDTTGKGNDYELICDGDEAEGADLVYVFTLNETLGVQVKVDFTSSYDWEQIYLVSACDQAGVLACDHTSGSPAQMDFTVYAPGTYYVIVDGDDGVDEGPFTLTLDLGVLTSSETDCADGQDNDLDGDTDCCDADCAADPVCDVEASCANGADDDCDGVQDCADPDCAAAAACEGESCQTPFQMNGGAAVSAGDLPLELVETGDNTNAAPDLTGSCDADTAAAVDHVYRLVLDGPAIATISHDYAGTSMWPAVYVFEGECLAGAQIACAKAMGGAAIIADLSLGAGTYFIVVDSSWGTDMGPYTLTVGLAAPADVEDICNDGVDNEGDGLADCDDPDCGEDICGPEQLPWTETFTYMPGDVIKGGIWNSEGDCGWTVTATLTPPNGFAEFAYAFGCSETEPYWIAGAILDVQGCGEISVTFDESGVDSEYAVYHSLAVFDGFDLVDEIELPTTGITGTWTASGPHVFDVTGHDFIRVAAGYMGDFADTWRMDNVVVQCTALTEICDDSQDNDGDNAVDCDDPDCADHLACLGEDCALAIPVRDTPVVLADAGVLLSFTGNTTDFAADYAGSCSSASAAAKDVVYSMTLADRMKVTVTHDFTGTFNYSSVYLFGGDAASCNSGVTLACHNGNSGVSTFTKTLDPGVYYIVVDANWGTDAGPYTFTVAFAAPPPTSETGLCADGLDNDGDTVKDCLDLPDCATDPACVDGDGDGVPDVADECPGGDDTVDADNNGIPDACEIDWAGEVWPLSGASFDDGDAIDVYVQVFKAGVTEPAGQGAGIEVALFYQSASAPAPASLPMAYNVDINNNDEYKATIPASASVGGEELDIWFEVTFVVGDGGNVYDGDVKDQADAFPIAYVITIDMTPNLFFSEYVEGGSFNKAVEILNAGSVTVDLKDCVILRYSNGSGTSANVFVTPAATPTPLAPGGLWVVCHPSIATPLVCDHTTSELNHNGNDALALSCNGVVMDFFGRAPDPTTPMVDAWTNGAGTVSTKDMTLRRKCTVTAGETTGADVFDPSVEWVAYAKDDLTNLGVDHCL